jgi:hypothetical protein
VADPAAVPDQPVREQGPLLAREQLPDFLLDLDRVFLLRPAEPAGEPAEVRVHRDARDAERVPQHHVGRLAADAGQGDQVLLPAGHLPAVPVAERLAEPDQAVGLGPEEPGRLDDLFQLRPVGRGVVRGGPVAAEQDRRHLIHQLVGGLRGQDGGDQEFQRGGEVELGADVRVELGELAVDPAGAADQCGM